MTISARILSIVLSPFLVLAGCASSKADAPPPVEAQAKKAKPEAAPTAEEASAFAKQVNRDLKDLWTYASRANWVKETYITDDTDALAAAADEKVMAFNAQAIKTAARFKDLELDYDTKRQLTLLRLSSSLPAPDDANKRAELAQIASKMTSLYGRGKWCPEGKEGDDEACLDLEELSDIIGDPSKSPKERLDAWVRWRTVSPEMKGLYERFVELGNEGAREIGFSDLGVLWKSRYDMSPEKFEQVIENLWEQVKPLYEQLHCYVRSRLAEKYPQDVKPDGTIPAHLLGNMWAQDWSRIYPLVEPYKTKATLDVTAALKKKKIDALGMVKLGESFFTSLGLKELPESFWQRSLFTKPTDRDVVCHASAWDVTFSGDVRIKMCIQPDEENLVTIHHELGHIYYFLYYNHLPVLYQDGAHDGFHEAIGDAIALSVNPQYLKQRGLLDRVPNDEEGLINVQMQAALSKIAFLPFGKLIDQWRWDVFSGKIPPEKYNEAWWELRRKYQGIHAPVERAEDAFDPGAKFHIPANVPYVRYFLAHVLQFQFHKAMCEAAGHEGPLHTCSIYGSKEAGEKLKALLELGSSRPWPEALFAMTKSREMDASALVEYFDPLMQWLKKQNEGQKCGW